MNQKRAEFGSEDKILVLQRIKEWFFPNAIAHKKELFFLGVPDGERKHSSQIAKAIHSKFFIKPKHYFRITVACKTNFGGELFLDFKEVVNFAVENQDFVSVFA